MYWRTNTFKVQDQEWECYKYFIIVHNPVRTTEYYNPVKKEIVYPINCSLEVKEKLVHNLEEFEQWYQENKYL